MRHPEFEAMIGPAKVYPELWRLLLGLAVVVFCYAGATALLSVLLFAAVGPLEFFGWVQRIAQPKEPLPTLMLLVTFWGMLLGPVLAAGACHLRGPGTLFGPAAELRRGIFVVIAVTVPIYAVILGAGMVVSPPVENLAWREWAGWLPWALPLILVQITAEEVLFRGYLQQQLAARFRARWVWMGVPSAIFAALHWNPMAGDAAWLVVLTTFVFALIAADLTARTGSLGPAIGLHFVNNVFGMLVISLSGGITGLAKWVTPYGLGESGPLVLSLGMNVVMFVLLWRLLAAVLDR